MLARIKSANDRLEDSWLGDALGALFLFLGCYGLFLIAGVLS